MTPTINNHFKALRRGRIFRKGVMHFHLAGLFFAVWLSQRCYSDEKLLDLLNRKGSCTEDRLTPEQAAQAKIIYIPGGLSQSYHYLVIYPDTDQPQPDSKK